MSEQKHIFIDKLVLPYLKKNLYLCIIMQNKLPTLIQNIKFEIMTEMY